MRIVLLLPVAVLSTCLVFAQVKPFNNADRFSDSAVLLDYWAAPSCSSAKYLFVKWGVTFDGQKGAVTFFVSDEPPISVGTPKLPRAVVSNGIPENGGTELPLVIDSDYPLNRIGFTMVPHNAAYVSFGLALSARTTITAFDRSGRLLGTVVREGKWSFIGLEAVGTEPISRVAIKSDQAIEGIAGLVLEYVSRPQFTTYVPQLADGAGLRSSIVFLNLSDSTAEGTLAVYDSAGEGIDLGSLGEVSSFSLPPRTSKTISTNAGPQLKAGYGIVTSDCPLQVQAVYTTKESDGTVREAGVAGVTASYRHVGAITKESESGVDTAIALVNPNEENSSVWFDLIDDKTGSALSTKFMTAAPRGQRAMFISDIFPELRNKDWRGTIRITSSGPVAVMMVRTLRGVATSSFPLGDY